MAALMPLTASTLACSAPAARLPGDLDAYPEYGRTPGKACRGAGLGRFVGRSHDAALTARKVDAEEAYRLGLVDRLVDAGQAAAQALSLAAQIAANSPVGVRQAKRAMRLGMDVPLAAGLAIEESLA